MATGVGVGAGEGGGGGVPVGMGAGVSVTAIGRTAWAAAPLVEDHAATVSAAGASLNGGDDEDRCEPAIGPDGGGGQRSPLTVRLQAHKDGIPRPPTDADHGDGRAGAGGVWRQPDGGSGPGRHGGREEATLVGQNRRDEKTEGQKEDQNR